MPQLCRLPSSTLSTLQHWFYLQPRWSLKYNIRNTTHGSAGPGETCHHHPLLRGGGLCFPSTHLQPCSSSNMVSTKDSSRRTADSIKKSLSAISECSSPGLEACCGHWCCPQNYFRFSIFLTVFTISFATLLGTNRNMANPRSRQWQDKECFSSVECRTWATGNFCCDGVCCDHLPEDDYGDYQVP